MRGYLVVANASAGSAEHGAIQRAIGILAEHAPTELVWTSDRDDLDVAIGRSGDRVVVIAGGDGSIHLAANRLHAAGRLDQPTAILPAGTGNDLARNLDLPLDLEEAATRIVNGNCRWYPVLETADGEIITNNVHVGLGVDAANRAVGLKPRLGKLAYPVGTIAEAVGYDGLDLSVTVDGSLVHDGPTVACVCLLGPSVGGGIELTAQSDRHDPVVEVVVVAGPSRISWPGLAAALARSDLASHEGVTVVKGTRVEWGAATDELEVDMDGEITNVRSPFRVEVRPTAWSIVR